MTTTLDKITPTRDTTELSLKNIIKTLPPQCFQKSPWRAWLGVLTSVLAVTIGYWGLAVAPWFLLPPLWIFTGTALTGFFVLGHDCGHRSFSSNRWVNDIVGHILFLPCFIPSIPGGLSTIITISTLIF